MSPHNSLKQIKQAEAEADQMIIESKRQNEEKISKITAEEERQLEALRQAGQDELIKKVTLIHKEHQVKVKENKQKAKAETDKLANKTIPRIKKATKIILKKVFES